MIPTPEWVSFRGRFRDYYMVWDHFGIQFISGAVQIKEYLAVISYANSTCKVKPGVDDSCPQNFFHSVSYVRLCHQDLRR